MTTLWEKLDRQAEQLINALDGQLQKPLEQVLSGRVFIEAPTSDTQVCADEVAQVAQSKGKPSQESATQASPKSGQNIVAKLA